MPSPASLELQRHDEHQHIQEGLLPPLGVVLPLVRVQIVLEVSDRVPALRPCGRGGGGGCPEPESGRGARGPGEGGEGGGGAGGGGGGLADDGELRGGGRGGMGNDSLSCSIQRDPLAELAICA